MRKTRLRRPAGATETTAPRRASARPRSYSIDIIRNRGAYTAFGYNAAAIANREGRTPTAGSGDGHLLWDRERLVSQARDFQRNNGIFAGMIDRAAGHVVGNGFGLQAKSEDPAWNTKAEAFWREFWERPEITGLVGGEGVEELLCTELMTCGDVAVLLTDTGLLQVIESEQIKGKAPNFDGIEKDAFGRPLAYWVAPYGRAGAPDVVRARRYVPGGLLFLTRRRRPSATRSAPPLTAVFPMIHRINDVCDSEAIAWQMLSRIAVSVNRTNAGAEAFKLSKKDEDIASEDEAGKVTTRLLELDYALIFHGEPGEEVKGIERNIPGRDFSASLTMFLRLLGLPLGLPLEFILLDWTKSNYSQSRAVLEEAHRNFLRWQQLLERFFHRPVYRWFVDRAVKDGRLPAREDAHAHEWIKPTFPWIDQLKEAQAYGEKLDRGFCTLTQVLKGLGQDREGILATREREVTEAIEIVKRIKAATGIDVSWQMFAGQKPPTAVQTSAVPASAEPAPRPSDDDEENESKAKTVIVEVRPAITVLPTPVTVENRIEPTPVTIDNRIETPSVNIENKIDVSPTPITVQNKIEPTPIENRIEVQPTPIQIQPTPVHVQGPPASAPAERRKRKVKFTKDASGEIAGAEEVD